MRHIVIHCSAITLLLIIIITIKMLFIFMSNSYLKLIGFLAVKRLQGFQNHSKP